MMPPDNPISWLVLVFGVIFFVGFKIARVLEEERQKKESEFKYNQDLVFFD